MVVIVVIVVMVVLVVMVIGGKCEDDSDGEGHDYGGAGSAHQERPIWYYSVGAEAFSFMTRLWRRVGEWVS